MVKIFLTMYLSIFYCYSYGANLFSNSLDMYSCSTELDARNCTKCERMKDVTAQVEVNVDKSVVILTLYVDTKNIGSNALENCKVVDKKNWQCGHAATYDQFQNFSQNIHTMTKGKYHNISLYKSPGIPKYNLTPSNFETLLCAK